MKMKYNDLDLKIIRDTCDLDFAHYTYEPGMCTCCNYITDFDSKYWKDANKPIEISNEITYIIFCNADNIKGCIKDANEELGKKIYVECNFRDDNQMNQTCRMLLKQLGSEYKLKIIGKHMLCFKTRTNINSKD